VHVVSSSSRRAPLRSILKLNLPPPFCSQASSAVPAMPYCSQTSGSTHLQPAAPRAGALSKHGVPLSREQYGAGRLQEAAMQYKHVLQRDYRGELSQALGKGQQSGDEDTPGERST